jgi:hypothetical protein
MYGLPLLCTLTTLGMVQYGMSVTGEQMTSPELVSVTPNPLVDDMPHDTLNSTGCWGLPRAARGRLPRGAAGSGLPVGPSTAAAYPLLTLTLSLISQLD